MTEHIRPEGIALYVNSCSNNRQVMCTPARHKCMYTNGCACRHVLGSKLRLHCTPALAFHNGNTPKARSRAKRGPLAYAGGPRAGARPGCKTDARQPTEPAQILPLTLASNTHREDEVYTAAPNTQGRKLRNQTVELWAHSRTQQRVATKDRSMLNRKAKSA